MRPGKQYVMLQFRGAFFRPYCWQELDFFPVRIHVSARSLIVKFLKANREILWVVKPY